nr:hypothetical protein [Tanacetum cinerariifolium]
MDQPNLTFAKIVILDTGKFEQWKFRIQQYLQNEHYALWEVIEFGDSYKAHPKETGKGPASESSAKKKGMNLRFSKYETAKELWEEILKTFGGNGATKKTKKSQLKQKYGNFKAEGSETLEQTFNRLKAIVSHLEFMDVEIEQDDLNQKFLTSLAPEWLIGKGEVHTASVPTASIQISTASTDVAATSLSHDTSYMANEEENHDLIVNDEVPTEFALMAKSSSSLPKFVDDTVTDYSRPTPSIDATKCNNSELKSSKSFIFEHEESSGSIMSKLMIKFVKESDCPRVIKTNNTKNARKSTVKYTEMYRNTSKSPKVRGNISYLSEYEPYNRGYVSFGQGGGKITDFKFKDDTNVLLRTPRQHNMYTIDLNNIVPHKNLTCLVAKALVDESMLWHRRTKDETSRILRNFITEIENLKDLKVKIIRCDNRGEFKNKEMNEFCTKKGIRREFSNDRTPQQNRIAERRNRTLIKAARTMLADAKLLVTFWAEAVNTACYVQNKVLVNKSQNKTPYELFNSRTPTIGFLRLFGCYVMILNTLYHLGKFDAKGDEGYFVGYSMSSKAFRVFNKRTKKVEEYMHVDFLENKLIEKGAGPNWLFDIDTLNNSMNYVSVVIAETSFTNITAHMETRNSDAPDGCNTDDPESSGISNPTATSKVPLTEQVEPAVSLTVESEIPTVSSLVPTVCLDISPKSSSGPRLITKGDFSQKETPSLDNALTLSNRVRPIGIKWVLKNKKDERGIVIKNKASLVAQKYTQKEGINYKEVFALVARIEAIRLFLAYASFMGFIVYQMDVKSACLYGTIDEEVYVMQPSGFQDLEFPDRVYKVEKAIYGLHQAPRAWYGTLSKYLLDNSFQRGTIDQTLFIKKHKREFLLVQVYGKDEPGKDVELHLYRSMIRSLMYLTASRPDIMFVVCASARHQVTPKECHLHAVKRIFRYLKGHPKLGLWYLKESPFDLVAYLDSDYGVATQDRKSTTGGCQFMGRRLISWQCENRLLWPLLQLRQNMWQLLVAVDKLYGYKIRCWNMDEPASLFRDDRQREAFPTVSSLDAGQDMENIAKTSALRYESSPRARVKSLKDKEIRSAEPTQEDAPITRGIMEIGEELGADKSTELGSNDTEEMVNVLSSIEAVNILTSGGVAASVSLASGVSAVSVPTVSGSFPTHMRNLIIGEKDKGKQKVVESEVPKKRKLQEQIDAQVAREMEEEFARENQRLREKIKLISELVKYQDHRTKIFKYQAQQSKPLSKKEQREFYMSVLRSHAGWKTKHFRGMTLEQLKEKFTPTSKNVSEGVSEEELKGMMQLVPLEEVYVEALQRGSTSAMDFGQGNLQY